MKLSKDEFNLLILSLSSVASWLARVQSPFGMTGPSNDDAPAVRALLARLYKARNEEV